MVVPMVVATSMVPAAKLGAQELRRERRFMGGYNIKLCNVAGLPDWSQGSFYGRRYSVLLDALTCPNKVCPGKL